MSLSYSQNIILQIMKRCPDLGKTKLMKIIYMLQQVKKIDLGYDFDIYTYGPYSSDVLESIDELTEEGLILSKMYQYNNYVGYSLTLTNDGAQALHEINRKVENAIRDILDFADGKSAKDLELYSTIVFINHFYSRSKSGNNSTVVTKKVHEIKPHFDESSISDAYTALASKNFIKA